MPSPPEPSEDNDYLAGHVQLLCDSLRRVTQRDLINPALHGVEAAKALFIAPFVVLSHNTDADPIFNYANRTALDLFELTWTQLTTLPSRQSAEPPNQNERARLLAEVTTSGFIDNYSGIRISRSGRRFLITRATVWNLVDAMGNHQGQAATFSEWEFLE